MKTLIAFSMLFVLIVFFSGCTQNIPSEEFCEKDTDCACGVHKNTGNCFYGNKNYVDTSKQCPDFCAGIGGHLSIICENNKCTQKSSFKCSLDSDCVPSKCCHSTSCTLRSQIPNCEGVACTEECRGGTMDCGQGLCACINGECQVEWAISREKYCEIDDDCTIQSTDNCCGREAVNKNYSNGTHQICLIMCPEYTTKCENNICVLISLD